MLRLINIKSALPKKFTLLPKTYRKTLNDADSVGNYFGFYDLKCASNCESGPPTTKIGQVPRRSQLSIALLAQLLPYKSALYHFVKKIEDIILFSVSKFANNLVPLYLILIKN